MKCYMMGPHRIGLARPLYWKHPSLKGPQERRARRHRFLMEQAWSRGGMEAFAESCSLRTLKLLVLRSLVARS